MQLKNKVAIVTGAGRGIGRAIALAFANEGAKVVCAARSIDEINKVAEETNGEAIQCDVGKEEDIRNLIERRSANLGASTYS